MPAKASSSTCRPWPTGSAPGTASLAPLIELIRRHVLAGERFARRRHDGCRCWPKTRLSSAGYGPNVRDDRPFAGPDPPAALFFYSRNRSGEHPNRHLAGYAGILQAMLMPVLAISTMPGAGPARSPRRPAGSHGRRKFFVLADLGKSPLALEAVRRIDGGLRDRARDQTVSPPSSGARSARNGSGRSSARSRDGCARERPGCRVTPRSPRPWITCSSAGPPSPAFSTTAASAYRTTLSSARCADRSRAPRMAVRRLRPWR